jgi:hypothetical protein
MVGETERRDNCIFSPNHACSLFFVQCLVIYIRSSSGSVPTMLFELQEVFLTVLFFTVLVSYSVVGIVLFLQCSFFFNSNYFKEGLQMVWQKHLSLNVVFGKTYCCLDRLPMRNRG